MKCKQCKVEMVERINYVSNGSGVQEYPTGDWECKNKKCKLRGVKVVEETPFNHEELLHGKDEA